MEFNIRDVFTVIYHEPKSETQSDKRKITNHKLQTSKRRSLMMKTALTITLCTLLFVGQAMAADQQKTTKEAKNEKAKPATAEQQKGNKELKTQKEKLSYSLGYDAGTRMLQSSVDIDPEAFSRAFRDGLAGNKSAMTDEEMRAALVPLQEEMKAKRAEEMKKMAEKNKQMGELNKQEGATFLAENAKKEGVQTLPSGLQYKVVKEGTGKAPQPSDMVTVHYRGTLINGTEFDSSHKRGQPATLGVDKVIKGWTEALQLMKEGSQWLLYIPSELAYGERGAGTVIGPNQTLIFDVELLSIQAPAEKTEANAPK
jgi:FKBP-type peptidyl-prolyl cis-trans isomerase FklB